MIVEPHVGVHVLAGDGQRPQLFHIEHLIGELRNFSFGLSSRLHYPVGQVTNKVEKEVALRNADHCRK